MPPSAIAYLVVLLVIALLDALWLGVLATDFFRAGIGHLLAEQPRLGAAAAFYLAYAAGVVRFAVTPARGAAGRAARQGALLGGFAYMTYDLTNLAVLRDWPLSVALVDIAWGSAITAVAAGLAARATVRLVR